MTVKLFSAEIKDEIFKLYSSGHYSIPYLAHMKKCSTTTIRRIIEEQEVIQLEHKYENKQKVMDHKLVNICKRNGITTDRQLMDMIQKAHDNQMKLFNEPQIKTITDAEVLNYIKAMNNQQLAIMMAILTSMMASRITSDKPKQETLNYGKQFTPDVPASISNYVKRGGSSK